MHQTAAKQILDQDQWNCQEGWEWNARKHRILSIDSGSCSQFLLCDLEPHINRSWGRDVNRSGDCTLTMQCGQLLLGYTSVHIAGLCDTAFMYLNTCKHTKL